MVLVYFIILQQPLGKNKQFYKKKSFNFTLFLNIARFLKFFSILAFANFSQARIVIWVLDLWKFGGFVFPFIVVLILLRTFRSCSFRFLSQGSIFRCYWVACLDLLLLGFTRRNLSIILFSNSYHQRLWWIIIIIR